MRSATQLVFKGQVVRLCKYICLKLVAIINFKIFQRKDYIMFQLALKLFDDFLTIKYSLTTAIHIHTREQVFTSEKLEKLL